MGGTYRGPTFGGRVERATPGFMERLLSMAATFGDFRDFDRIRAWARDIAAAVVEPKNT